jgi:uncharacterized protein YcaQ
VKELWRARAVGWSTGAPAPLAGAIERLGFVQADPIRSPARAQDLILRHRVRNYRAGDLERRFRGLEAEEDYLYAYGFMPLETARLLHPRHDPESADGRHRPAGLAAEVLAFVRERGPTHPAELTQTFGRERAVNGWGAFSKATTRALHSLQWHGLLRVAHRIDGVRVYQAVPARPELLSPGERLRRLALLIAQILAPVPQASLQATISHAAHATRGFAGRRDIVRELLASGELDRAEAEGEPYVWPADMPEAPNEVERRVRFLAPFDPIVWDRRRFEHLWGWQYRFEAYVPAPKRRLGYYAMPLLWGGDIIGWVNCSLRDGLLDVAPGFVKRRPSGRDFTNAFDREVAKFERFLGSQPDDCQMPGPSV